MPRTRPKAGDTMLGVARVRAEERGGPSGYADRQEAAVREPLPAPVRSVGGELVPEPDFATETLPAILDTLASPDAIGADASRDRLDLAKDAGSLELALDTAETIGAGDSLERMLAHQMATAHVLAMKAAVVMKREIEFAAVCADPVKKQAACVEANRLAGTYARLTGSFQAGMQTLQRMRSGGRQVVVVQHNTVSPGGQVAMGVQVGGGGRRRATKAEGANRNG